MGNEGRKMKRVSQGPMNGHSELMCLINFVRLTSEENRKYVSFKMRYKRHLIEILDCKYELNSYITCNQVESFIQKDIFIDSESH